jgi:hypothetical protein
MFAGAMNWPIQQKAIRRTETVVEMKTPQNPHHGASIWPRVFAGVFFHNEVRVVTTAERDLRAFFQRPSSSFAGVHLHPAGSQ